jgi:hypothetical protein
LHCIAFFGIGEVIKTHIDQFNFIQQFLTSCFVKTHIGNHGRQCAKIDLLATGERLGLKSH